MQTVSSSSYSIALRSAISTIRRETVQRQVELQTGSMADVALALGASVGRLNTLSVDVSRIDRIVSANGLADGKIRFALVCGRPRGSIVR